MVQLTTNKNIPVRGPETVTKMWTLRKKGPSNSICQTSKECNLPKFSIENSLFCNNSMMVGAIQKKRPSPLAPPTVEIRAQEIETERRNARGTARSGVYFNNQLIFDRRHPAQLEYKAILESKVPDLPVGIPLAEPPRLFTSASKPALKKIAPMKKKESLSQPRCSTSRNGGSIDVGEGKPSNRTRRNEGIISIPKRLPREEYLFLEAAILLSASKASSISEIQETCLSLRKKLWPSRDKSRRGDSGH